MENSNRVVLLLDESASMYKDTLEVRQSLNQFVKEQRQTFGSCYISLIKFNSRTTIVWKDRNLFEVEELREEDYKPEGMTALYDAIGHAFETFQDKKNVVLVIFTDGLDNLSKRYTKGDIQKFIDEYKNQETFAWNIIYIGAEASLKKQGENIGISHTPSLGTCNLTCPVSQYPQMATRLSRAITDYRSASTKTVVLESPIVDEYSSFDQDISPIRTLSLYAPQDIEFD